MELQNDVEQSDLLLNCIEELRQENQSELLIICAKMLEKHNISHELTKSLLENLKTSAKIFTVEQKGVVVYMTIKPQKAKKPRRSSAGRNGHTINETKKINWQLCNCVKEINQQNNSQGASFDEILQKLKSTDSSQTLVEPQELQKALDRQVSFMKLKRNEAGLYMFAKKRGRPIGTSTASTSRRSPKTPSTPTPKKSPDEASKRANQLGKRKRIKKSNDDFEFYDTPGNDSMQLLPASTDPICDFCLKTSSTNRKGLFEELLMCKDCAAKAHASCMGYSEILARRAKLGPWQCIDCKTCSLCLDSGDPDDLLFCDACDKGYHMFCHDPAIKEKPKNKWACRTCMDDGVCTDDLIATAPSSVDMAVDGASPSQDVVFTEPNTSAIQQSNVSVVNSVDNSSAIPIAASPSVVTMPITEAEAIAKTFLPAVPNQWSPAHVSQYIRECGFPNEAQKFFEQEIDGKALLLLQRQDVLCNMTLKLGPALKIYEKLKVLQKNPSSKSAMTN